MEILGIIIGAILVIKANWMTTTFGYIGAAEKYLRIWGGTRLFWKLLGIIIILISFISISGFLEPILLKIFGSTIGSLQQADF